MPTATKKGRIPTFHSDQEEREFWARHSVEEFARDLTDLEIEIRPPRRNRSRYVSTRRTSRSSALLRRRAASDTQRWPGRCSKAGSRGRGARGKRRAAGRSVGRPDLLRSGIDYAQNYASEGLNSRQSHPSPANVDKKTPR